jgi:S-adenosylmethionine uptake transporter
MIGKTAPAPNAGGNSSRRNLHEGLLLMVLGMLLLPGIDAIAKGLSGSVSPGQVAWSRFFFQSLILLPFVLRFGGLRVGRKLWVHAARGFLIALATLLFFASLGELPLADAISIFFVEPFILTLLSALLLGERIGWPSVGGGSWPLASDFAARSSSFAPAMPSSARRPCCR